MPHFLLGEEGELRDSVGIVRTSLYLKNTKMWPVVIRVAQEASRPELTSQESNIRVRGTFHYITYERVFPNDLILWNNNTK